MERSRYKKGLPRGNRWLQGSWLAAPLALSVLGSGAWLLSGQEARADGFVDDGKLTLTLRNYYFGSDRRNGRADQKDWTQGFLLDYQSGFTQGTVGLGVDAFGYLGMKLDGGPGRRGTGNLPVHAGNEPADEYSRWPATAHGTGLRHQHQSPVAAKRHRLEPPQHRPA